MIKKLLITALVIINFHYGSAQVTMSPQLAKIVPENLPPLREEYIICFNKYWDIKESYDKQIRQQWNCTNGCTRGPECCIAYKVWDSLSGLKLSDECSHGAISMIRAFLPIALKQIRDKCEPDYAYGSTLCIAMEELLPSVPLSGSHCDKTSEIKPLINETSKIEALSNETSKIEALSNETSKIETLTNETAEIKLNASDYYVDHFM